MVGLFSGYNNMVSSLPILFSFLFPFSGHFFDRRIFQFVKSYTFVFIEDKKEDRQAGRVRDEEENERKILLRYDDDDDDDVGDDDDGEFKPIEHPSEPPEDDLPAKCPTMPDLSFIYVCVLCCFKPILIFGGVL